MALGCSLSGNERKNRGLISVPGEVLLGAYHAEISQILMYY